MAKFRSPLARARGLGSAHKGLHHWLIQRLTAIGLVPLSVYFIASVIALSLDGYGALQDYLEDPLNATMMILMILIGYWHAALGLQVVIEDYVSDRISRTAALIMVRIAAVFLGLYTAISVIRIGFGG